MVFFYIFKSTQSLRFPYSDSLFRVPAPPFSFLRTQHWPPRGLRNKALHRNYDSQKAAVVRQSRRASSLPGRGGRLDLEEKMAASVAGLGLKPPIQIYGLEGRYATALYSAASKQKKLDQVEKELTRVLAVMKDPKLSGIVMNPYVKTKVKQQVVNDLLLKEKLSPLTINFVKTLAENSRLPYTTGVISAFGKMMSAYRGEILCSVTTAQTLDEASLTELKTTLNGFLAKGETLKLEIKSDPSIVGGMIVSIGDKYIDMSTKTKIQKLSRIMQEVV
uniref:ATP synthase peripheral stalk subunit OSCP, mitochondrial n=1 Tax=Laticauda laticaudata TaxID=8630 RepID=A0A8C5SHR6_LATLA